MSSFAEDNAKLLLSLIDNDRSSPDVTSDNFEAADIEEKGSSPDYVPSIFAEEMSLLFDKFPPSGASRNHLNYSMSSPDCSTSSPMQSSRTLNAQQTLPESEPYYLCIHGECTGFSMYKRRKQAMVHVLEKHGFRLIPAVCPFDKCKDRRLTLNSVYLHLNAYHHLKHYCIDCMKAFPSTADCENHKFSMHPKEYSERRYKLG